MTPDQETIARLMAKVDYLNYINNELSKVNKINNEWGKTLFVALENLYNDYAEYYPSAIENSPAMKAAYELINEEDGEGE